MRAQRKSEITTLILVFIPLILNSFYKIILQINYLKYPSNCSVNNSSSVLQRIILRKMKIISVIHDNDLGNKEYQT